MRLFHFGPEVGHAIDRFGSVNVLITFIADLAAHAQVHCMYIGAGGIVGHHPTVNNQLFLVMNGSGWVRGGSGEVLPISSRQAAFWEAGEWHECRTETGMTAIVIEGEGLSPSELLIGE